MLHSDMVMQLKIFWIICYCCYCYGFCFCLHRQGKNFVLQNMSKAKSLWDSPNLTLKLVKSPNLTLKLVTFVYCLCAASFCWCNSAYNRHVFLPCLVYKMIFLNLTIFADESTGNLYFDIFTGRWKQTTQPDHKSYRMNGFS